MTNSRTVEVTILAAFAAVSPVLAACSDTTSSAFEQVNTESGLLVGSDGSLSPSDVTPGPRDTEDSGPEVSVDGSEQSDVPATECTDASDCPASNAPCSAPTCTSEGVCVQSPVPDATPCDDGDACTTGDVCVSGVCSGTEIACPSGPCTDAICDFVKGCSEVPSAQGTSCDDGNTCTKGDTCDAGECVGGENTCECTSDGECSVLQTSVCEAELTCQEGLCQPSGDPVTCPPAGPCQESFCDDAEGCTTNDLPNGTACETSVPCASATCQNGVCEPQENPCDDGNACTTDACDPASNTCSYSAIVCDDSNPCTENICDEGDGCTHPPVGDGTSCPAVGGCAVAACSAGQCEPQCECVSAADCSDDNYCTQDACAADGTCEYSPANENLPCDDGDICTLLTLCSGGECEAPLGGCDDDNACTDDGCGLTGCTNTPTLCDDNDACTQDTCDVEEGCVFTDIPGCGEDPQCLNVPAGSACDDGNADTVSDICLLGTCEGFRLVAEAPSSFGEERRYTRMVAGNGAWYLGRQSFGNSFPADFGGVIVDADDPDGVTVMAGSSVVQDFYRDIQVVGDRAFAVTYFGDLVVLDQGGWSSGHPFAVALENSGTEVVRHIWGLSSNQSTSLWVAGGQSAPYIRRCQLDQGAQAASCQPQTLPTSFQTTWFPRAMRGYQECSGSGCQPVLVMAADGDNDFGDGIFNSVFSNTGGAESPWPSEFTDLFDGPTEVQDLAVDDAGNTLIVGTNGFMRFRASDGSVSNSWTNTVNEQSNSSLVAVWFGSGAWFVVALRVIGDSQLESRLLVAPANSDLSSSSNWNAYTLAIDALGATGAFDVWGDGTGQIRAVGGYYGTSPVARPAQWVRAP